MHITSFTDCGLRMLMQLTSPPLRAYSTAELAKGLDFSRNHLSKIMQCLARGGIVATRRGAGGGATLARAPQDIRLGEVIHLLEQGQPIVECFNDETNSCTVTLNCRLRHRLRAAEAAFLAELDRATLAQIAFTTVAAA